MSSACVRIGVLLWLAAGAALRPALAAEPTAADAPLFRVFLTDGSSIVTYGEYVRVGDEVVLSTPLGSSAREPRLHVLTLPASVVDWPRTERYTQSARYQRYAAQYGEVDFAVLSAEVSAMLNQMAVAEPGRAREIANEARRRLVEWPAAHFGYRQHDISSIVSLIDETVRGLAEEPGSGEPPLSFVVTMAPPVSVEPLLGMMSPRDQVARFVTLVTLLPRSSDRTALLRAALTILDDPASGIEADDTTAVRRSIQSQIQDEVVVDDRYLRLAKKLTDDARRAASGAHVAGVERVLASVEVEDARLGRKRPDTVRALMSELEAQLDAARDLRLRRDQWELRRPVYRAYADTVSAQVAQLVKASSSLDAIRRQAGPQPTRLVALQETLSGGADRLQRMAAPEQLRMAHELLVGAWRFAEGAADARYAAVVSGDGAAARQASSAAAGALLLLGKAQAELRSVLEMPKLP